MPVELREQSGCAGTAYIGVPEDSSVVATISVTPEGQVVGANKTMLTLLGHSSLQDLASRDFKTEILTQRSDWELWKNASSARLSDVEIVLCAPDRTRRTLRGDMMPAMDRGDVVREVYGVFVDVTEVRNLHSAMRRTGRMEAVAALTAGIAHDFNNLLTVLVGNLYLIAEAVRSNPDQFEKVKRARDAAKRGSDLTRQLLSFARDEKAVLSTYDPGNVIRTLVPLLKRAVGPQVSVSTQIDSEISPVDGNVSQLESILVNLTINARDALDGSGKVVLGAANRRVDAAKSSQLGIPSGNYVQISVSDNGDGIPDAIREKVFEPFFSTKGEGKGTGLGLSMVRWFAEQAGGIATLDTTVGRGTMISVLLPCANTPAADTSKTMPLSTLPTGNERVLVLAEDEEVQSTIHQILEVLGYKVWLSKGVDEASEHVRNERIDLAMIDSTVGVSPSLIQKLLDIRPGMHAVWIRDSGDSSGARGEGAYRLTKPFSLVDLATIVRRALDGTADD